MPRNKKNAANAAKIGMQLAKIDRLPLPEPFTEVWRSERKNHNASGINTTYAAAFSLERQAIKNETPAPSAHFDSLVSQAFKVQYKAVKQPSSVRISSQPLILATTSVWIGCAAKRTVASQAIIGPDCAHMAGGASPLCWEIDTGGRSNRISVR